MKINEGSDHENMSNKRYTDKQINDFMAYAQEVTPGRAMRELGYPGSYATVMKWYKARNVEPNLDEHMKTVKKYHLFKENEDALLIAETGMDRILDQLRETVDLTPDEQKKLAEAFQKYANSWMLLKGKATSINENRETTQSDLEIIDLIQAERAKNALLNDHELDIRD